MSNIYKKGDQFTINGKRRPYLMYSSFCLMGLYQNKRRSDARKWLDRLQRMGMDGPRLFGETWAPDPNSAFFGNPEWTPYARIIDDDQPPTSQLKLLTRYPMWVDQLAFDLEDRNMVAEFCVVATVKHLPHVGHILNRAAQMFASMFPPDDSPFLYETINEADAYTNLTADEVALMGPRWQRDEGGDHTNFPGSLIGVSPGGAFSPSWDDSGYTHRNLHLPRGNYWDLGPDHQPIGEWLPIAKVMAGRRPLALNETVHYIDKEEWRDWIKVAPKWAGLSTSNAPRVYQYMEDVLASGVSMCVHTRTGMATNPAEPLSTLEQMLVERADNGGTWSPVPSPEPPPEPPDEPGDTSPGGFWGRLLEFLEEVFFGKRT